MSRLYQALYSKHFQSVGALNQLFQPISLPQQLK